MRSFGKLEDGRGIEAVTLGGDDGLQAEVLTYGAILRRLTYPVRGVRRDLILHFDRLEHYERDRAYVGSLVGPLRQSHRRRPDSNSTAETHTVTANEGVNHLHGGALGFGKRVWRDTRRREEQGASGPGLSVARRRRRVSGQRRGHGRAHGETATRCRSVLSARSDAPTPINLTYHPYFNLAGGSSSPRPSSGCASRRALSTRRPGLIPTGEIAPVEGHDVRLSRKPAA